jgi:uncharacterized protein (DUF2336 family)
MTEGKMVQASQSAEQLALLIPFLPGPALVDLAMIGNSYCHTALACAASVSAQVSAVLAELANDSVLKMLVENKGATVTSFSLIRMVERHYASEQLLSSIEARQDLNDDVWTALASARLRVVLQMLSESDGDAAIDQAIVALLWASDPREQLQFAKAFFRFGKVTPRLLRVAFSTGAVDVICVLLSVLSGDPESRIRAVVAHADHVMFRQMLQKSGCPKHLIPEFELEFLRLGSRPAPLSPRAA